MQAPQIRTPLVLFGVQDDDLLVVRNVEAAITHIREHRQADQATQDFELFDFDGRPVLPDPALSGGHRILEPWEYLDLRVRRLLERHGGALPVAAGGTGSTGDGPAVAQEGGAVGAPGADAPEPLGELPDAVVRALVDYLERRIDLTELVTVLVHSAVHGHSGSALHNLCHRLHICT